MAVIRSLVLSSKESVTQSRFCFPGKRGTAVSESAREHQMSDRENILTVYLLTGNSAGILMGLLFVPFQESYILI